MQYIAGIDIGGTNLKLGIFDETGRCVYSDLEHSERGDSQVIAAQIVKMLGKSSYKVCKIGAGVPGVVYRPGGRVVSGNLQWNGEPFEAQLSKLTGLPVRIDNDAQVAMMAETMPGGACHGLKNCLYLTLGTGVGGAILLDGKPWRGHDNAGAELGHIITHAGGLRCGCGMRGCFEMYASAGALSRFAGGVRARTVIDDARRGDKRMRSALSMYARELSNGICSLYMIFKPQAIVLGGGLSAGSDLLIPLVLEHVQDGYGVNKATMEQVLKVATARNDAGMAGAAELARVML